MNQITEAVSGLSDSTLVWLIVVSGILAIVCMMPAVSFKSRVAKFSFIMAATISQACLIVLSISQVWDKRREKESLENVASQVSTLGTPSQHPMSGKSMKVKCAIERVMFQRGFSSTFFDEDNEGLVCYFSMAGNEWADTFIFAPQRDIEKLGSRQANVIDHDVNAYIFTEFPFTPNGARHFNECITDLHSHVTMLVGLITRQRFDWEYKEGNGYVFFFRELEREFRIEGVRADKLMMSTRFAVQELIFKWLAIEGFNSYIKR